MAEIPCPFEEREFAGFRLVPDERVPPGEMRLASCYVEPDGSMHGLSEVPAFANHDAVRDRLTDAQVVELGILRAENAALRRERDALVKAQRDWRAER